MKKYKLLKDLPWLEAGTIIELWDKIKIWEWLIMPKEVYSLLIHHTDELIESWWLEKIEEEPKSIYELKEWDVYFGIPFWEIEKFTVINYKDAPNIYNLQLKVWNVFISYEEAEKELEKRKALAKIKKWIWENKIELWYNRNWLGEYYYSIAYSLEINDFVVIPQRRIKRLWEITFQNKEDAERCLKECRKEWEILFDLDGNDKEKWER